MVVLRYLSLHNFALPSLPVLLTGGDVRLGRHAGRVNRIVATCRRWEPSEFPNGAILTVMTSPGRFFLSSSFQASMVFTALAASKSQALLNVLTFTSMNPKDTLHTP